MAKRVRVSKGEGDESPVAVPAVATGARAAKGKAAPAAPVAGGAENKHVMLPAFLSKTFEIFSMPEFANICGWNASGDTIIVSQLEAFVAMVLPRFFKHRNFPSFVRQLNLYGFHKTVLDSKRLEFQHPYFKRDRPDLLHHIKRKVSSSSGHNNNQALVNSSAQNSRLDAHREISDTLLREMKELRQRSDAMEKRLRELEIDNAIVRSDNVKLWKHLESAKDKQLIMQEKMKKIMWILYQIYRGKHPAIPKLSTADGNTVISDDYINSSMLGPKEFREVLRFLAMDEPALLPDSSMSVDIAAPGQASRKRKFVEVPTDVGDLETLNEPSSFLQVGSPLPANSLAMTVPTNPLPVLTPEDNRNNVLSLFSPINVSPRNSLSGTPPTASGLALTNGVSTEVNTHPTTPPPATPAHSTEMLTTPLNGTMNGSSTTSTSSAVPSTSDSIVASIPSSIIPHLPVNQLGLGDDDLPLLSDSEGYSFGDGEEHVMKKLEDFESSLLDEYDVNCLDTLLQQLKNTAAEKSSTLPPVDPEEIFVGPEDGTSHTA